jgi:hypothetical protein
MIIALVMALAIAADHHRDRQSPLRSAPIAMVIMADRHGDQSRSPMPLSPSIMVIFSEHRCVATLLPR